jgi:murein DD-endopeptidase MepM/ murein hydrolase activator NlpD
MSAAMRRSTCLLLLIAACGGGPAATGHNGGGQTGNEAFENSGAGGGSSGGGGGGGGGAPAIDPCSNATLGDGAYCGSGIKGDVTTLYHCVGKTTASSAHCALGCHVAPPGVSDYCEDGGIYHYPWTCNVAITVTQGNNGDICGGGTGDHTGVQAYAWDFGLSRHSPVLASRAGTVTVAANVTGPGQNCYNGCTQPYGTSAFWTCCNGCINTSNHVNVQHADGTVATYWHLDVATVKVGDVVPAGGLLGYSGTSGCSSGPHLHFQVMGNCPTGYCQSISVAFLGNQKPACGNVEKSDNACM